MGEHRLRRIRRPAAARVPFAFDRNRTGAARQRRRRGARGGDGKSWATEMLAREFAAWLQDGRDVALLVGGPDGLADSCRARADMKWSLSPLTLPHMLVRIVAAEQLYRAW